MALSVYLANALSNSVAVIDTVGFTLIANVAVGNSPRGVCVTPDLSTVYVTNFTDNTVSVISALCANTKRRKPTQRWSESTIANSPEKSLAA